MGHVSWILPGLRVRLTDVGLLLLFIAIINYYLKMCVKRNFSLPAVDSIVFALVMASYFQNVAMVMGPLWFISKEWISSFLPGALFAEEKLDYQMNFWQWFDVRANHEEFETIALLRMTLHQRRFKRVLNESNQKFLPVSAWQWQFSGNKTFLCFLKFPLAKP